MLILRSHHHYCPYEKEPRSVPPAHPHRAHQCANTPELLATLERFTYDAKAIQEALAIYERIEKLTRQREQALEVQYQTTQLLQQAKEELLYLFRIHADTARLAYRREAQYQDTLNLSAAAPRETAACLRHIKRFYAHVPVAMMTKYHVPQKELAQAANCNSGCRKHWLCKRRP